MRFEAEHRFHGSPAAVAAILADPSFYASLQLPDLSQPDVLDHRTDGTNVVLRLRYLFLGSLQPVVRRLLGKRQLAWIQEIDIDRSTGSGRLTYQAEADPKRLHGSADFTLQAITLDSGKEDSGTQESGTLESGGAGCVQRLTGELVVNVPFVGSRAERQIVAGLQRRLDIEAQQLDSMLVGS
jgi:hypothetical protein